MNCATHAGTEATGYCRNCGKALCPECTREVRGALYCENCLAGMVGGQQPAPGAVSSELNPRLAAVLGLIPGLGAVYNGEYMKALVQVCIFGGLIAALAGDFSEQYKVFASLALACFYFYMPVDAYRVAKARHVGGAEPAGELNEGVVRSARPIGPFILILLGIMFLLANFGLLNEDWFAKAWPMGLIALGGWLLWQRMRTKSS